MSLYNTSLPPSGVGIYGRQQTIEFLARWPFVTLHFQRSDTPTKLAALKERGVKVWLFAGPEAWIPGAFPATTDVMVNLAERFGAEGIIADPETQWSGGNATDRARNGRALGQKLKDASSRTRVGMTSVPWMNALPQVAEIARGHIWGSPQIYHPQGNDFAALVREWYAPWQNALGPERVIPSIAGWPSNDRIHDLASYNAYLSVLPSAVGAVAWTTGETPSYIFDRLEDWRPGPLPARLALEARGWLMTTPGLILLAVGAIILLMLAFGAWRLLRR